MQGGRSVAEQRRIARHDEIDLPIILRQGDAGIRADSSRFARGDDDPR